MTLNIYSLNTKIGGYNMKNIYYSLNKILKHKALYNVIFGQRSNGKTFAVIDLMLKTFCKTGKPSAYIRRLDSEIVPAEVFPLLRPHMDNVKKYSKGKYNDYMYKSRCFYLIHRDENGDVQEISPAFIYCFALSISTKSKGADRGEFAYTLFDEFLTRKFYLNNEFLLYTEILSTIMRDRDGTIHFLVGNTVNKYCPYFSEMGLTHITEQKQGTIDIYTYNDTELKVAVEYCAMSDTSKPVSKYFAFDNPQLNMITRGMWELASYPHCMESVTKQDIIMKCYIIFDKNTLCVNIVRKNDVFLLVTPQTHSIPPEHIVYTYTASNNPYYIHDIRKDNTKLSRLLYNLIAQNKVFFTDNLTGEIFNNWIKYALKMQIWRS